MWGESHGLWLRGDSSQGQNSEDIPVRKLGAMPISCMARNQKELRHTGAQWHQYLPPTTEWNSHLLEKSCLVLQVNIQRQISF